MGDPERGYKTIAVLGKGGFGVVKKVQRLTDLEILACKVVHFREGEISLTVAQREYTTLSRLHHPHIVEYVDYHWRPDKAKLYMEYCSGGDLQQLIKQSEISQKAIPESQVWCVLSQLASALMYCHYGIYTTANGQLPPDILLNEWDPIIHRDIKPANVMICSHGPDIIEVKLADFGLSRIVDGETMPGSYAGTHQYQPPEIARANPSGIRWTKKCDIFSLGCTLYAMCTWKAPFSWRMEEFDVLEQIPATYSEKLRRCIASCLAFHSEDRHDAFDLLRLVQRVKSDTKTQHLFPLSNKFQKTNPKGANLRHHGQNRVQGQQHAEISKPTLPGSWDTSAWDTPQNPKREPSQERESKPEPFADYGYRPPTPPRQKSSQVAQRAPTKGATLGMPLADNTVTPKRLQQTGIRCPYCGISFPSEAKSGFSEEVQKHFETAHKRRHGRNNCAIEKCPFYTGPGIYSPSALQAHYDADHEGFEIVDRPTTTRQAHSEKTISSPVTTIRRPSPTRSGSESLWFCAVPGCDYGKGKFIGFTTESSLMQHTSRNHYTVTTEPPVAPGHTQPYAVPKSTLHEFKGRFYCSDPLCPYSVDKFLGYNSLEEGKAHLKRCPRLSSNQPAPTRIPSAPVSSYRRPITSPPPPKGKLSKILAFFGG